MESYRNNTLKAYEVVEAYPSLWRETVLNTLKPLKTIDTLIQQLDCVLKVPSCTLNEKFPCLAGSLETIIRHHLSEEVAVIQNVLDELSNMNNKLKSAFETVTRVYTDNIHKLDGEPTFYDGTYCFPSPCTVIGGIDDMLLYYSNKLTSAKYAVDTFNFTAASLNNIQCILDPEDDVLAQKIAVLVKSSLPTN